MAGNVRRGGDRRARRGRHPHAAARPHRVGPEARRRQRPDPGARVPAVAPSAGGRPWVDLCRRGREHDQPARLPQHATAPLRRVRPLPRACPDRDRDRGDGGRRDPRGDAGRASRRPDRPASDRGRRAGDARSWRPDLPGRPGLLDLPAGGRDPRLRRLLRQLADGDPGRARPGHRNDRRSSPATASSSTSGADRSAPAGRSDGGLRSTPGHRGLRRDRGGRRSHREGRGAGQALSRRRCWTRPGTTRRLREPRLRQARPGRPGVVAPRRHPPGHLDVLRGLRHEHHDPRPPGSARRLRSAARLPGSSSGSFGPGPARRRPAGWRSSRPTSACAG